MQTQKSTTNVSLYQGLDKTILYETFEYEGHFFKNEKDFREYIKDNI